MGESVALGRMTVELLGGLAIFLFGLDQMTTSLRAVAGERMRDVLSRITTNKFIGVFSGAFTTAVIQSSSVTTVLAVGFVSAGLMNLHQAIGMIMGAEIGTTVTAQLIAFKITKYALVALTIGFVMQFFSKNETTRRYGLMIMGFGLIFFGMNMMGDAMRPLRTYQPFIDLLQSMDNPFLAVLVSASFTALIQSSSATTGIIIVLAGQGLITLEQGIALVFGANIGTCVTALLASIGKERQALRTAMIHVTFNLAGVSLWFGFIDQMAAAVRWMSPVSTELAGMDRLAADTPRQIANAHTLFNVGNTMVFIWFTGTFIWLVNRLVPPRAAPLEEGIKPKYLDPVLVRTPSLALAAVRMELDRLGGLAIAMVRSASRDVLTGTEFDLERLADKDDDIDRLHGEIIRYLGAITRRPLTPRETELAYDYMSVANHYENIGDMVEVNLCRTGRHRIERQVVISPGTLRAVEELALRVVEEAARTQAAIRDQDRELAARIVAAKPGITDRADSLEMRLAERLIEDDPNRVATFQIESELIEGLKRVYYFTKRIAKIIAARDVPELEDEPSEAALMDD